MYFIDFYTVLFVSRKKRLLSRPFYKIMTLIMKKIIILISLTIVAYSCTIQLQEQPAESWAPLTGLWVTKGSNPDVRQYSRSSNLTDLWQQGVTTSL